DPRDLAVAFPLPLIAFDEAGRIDAVAPHQLDGLLVGNESAHLSVSRFGVALTASPIGEDTAELERLDLVAKDVPGRNVATRVVRLGLPDGDGARYDRAFLGPAMGRGVPLQPERLLWPSQLCEYPGGWHGSVSEVGEERFFSAVGVS